ncbi:MAG TPA: hypothetical protein VH370_14155, partial [Humisphaera sp.]|nr:hypothetical protein [Humisphaera sp.]
APLADIGHADGFLAIGRMDLPTNDGRRVGCVTIKAPSHKIADYPRYLREVIEACAGGYKSHQICNGPAKSQ